VFSLLEKLAVNALTGIRKCSWLWIMKDLTMHIDRLIATLRMKKNEKHTRFAGDVPFQGNGSCHMQIIIITL
jgi:hypothetical protein